MGNLIGVFSKNGEVGIYGFKDFNEAIIPGSYSVSEFNTTANAPVNVDFRYGLMTVFIAKNGYLAQIIYPLFGGMTVCRMRTEKGVWGQWNKI